MDTVQMSNMPNHERHRRIEIPERTAEQIESRIDGTEFDSVEEYVAVALERLLWELRRHEGQSPPDDRGVEADTSTDEDLEERLEALGYL